MLRDWGKLVLKDKSRSFEERQAETTRIWNLIVAARPGDALTAAQTADLFRHASLNETALKLYKAAVSLAPAEPHRTAENLSRVAEILDSFGYGEHSLDYIAEAAVKDPKDLSIQAKAAQYELRARHFDEALKYVDNAATLAAADEEREAVLKQRIEILQAAQRLDAEIEQLQTQLNEEPSPDSESWRKLANYQMAERRWADANAAIQKAIDLAPQAILPLTTAVQISELSGDFGRAADLSRKLAEVDRRQRGDHLMSIARFETQLGRPDQALEAGREVILSAPGNTDNYEF